MERKNISVCIATYNGEKYIYEQINSILKQLTEKDEIIISDDQSTDSTIQILKDFHDKRINIYISQNHLGCSHNFENAIKKANNDIIFLADQDDVWVEGKVSKMCKALDTCNLVVCDAFVTNENLEIKCPSLFNKLNVNTGFWINWIKSRYCGSCMAFDNKVKKKILPFPKKSKYCQHDYWITIVSELLFKTNLVRESLILYRRHDSNLSSGGFSDKNTRNLFIKIFTRIYCMIHLIIRVFKK